MVHRSILLVIAVEDDALRGTLATHLALAGQNILAMAQYDGALIERSGVERPCFLVLDEAAMAKDAGGRIERDWLAERWSGVVVLTRDALVPADGRDWITYLERGMAAAMIAELALLWS